MSLSSQTQGSLAETRSALGFLISGPLAVMNVLGFTRDQHTQRKHTPKK